MIKFNTKTGIFLFIPSAASIASSAASTRTFTRRTISRQSVPAFAVEIHLDQSISRYPYQFQQDGGRRISFFQASNASASSGASRLITKACANSARSASGNMSASEPQATGSQATGSGLSFCSFGLTQRHKERPDPSFPRSFSVRQWVKCKALLKHSLVIIYLK